MAGDHKCPVCSSTFTRPQHVARHMRSHTGDRPYKCVHCGDQFARSDLLSRHVNKCHASEKPPTTTQPARRKGHAQPGSSGAGVRGPAPPLIPPPGSRKICDPCAHSRTPAQCDSGLPCGKCLQRNTKCTYIDARRPAGAASASTSHLIPNPSLPLTVPSMAGPRPESIFPSQSAFNFTVPLYPQNLDSRPASTYHPVPTYNNSDMPPLSVSASSSESVESHAVYDCTFMLSYTQPHLAPVYPTGNIPAPTPTQIPQYSDDRKPVDQSYLAQQFDLPDFLYNAPDLTQPARANGQQLQQQQQQYGFDPAYHDPTQRGLASDYAFQPQQQQAYAQPRQQAPPGHDEFPAIPEGGFSNAFGLMSLDDPAVAAEMHKANSFFAPGAASRTTKEGTTPGRDANMAELRDFWKAFMRDNTPATEKPPAMRRSLSKMASLPDIKTPPVDGVPGPMYSTTEELRAGTNGAGGREDLSSYEQAVLARKAPSLTLAPPQRRSTRPSFKRLASQTLGPSESKSAKVSHPGAAEAIAAYESGIAARYDAGRGDQARYEDGRAQAQAQGGNQARFDEARNHAPSPGGGDVPPPPPAQHERTRLSAG